MRRGSVLSGSAFRSAMLFSLVFVVVLGTAGSLIVEIIRQSTIAELRAGIVEDVNLLRDANMTGGESELVRFVNNAVATRSDKQFSFGLFSTDGALLAGNMSLRPGFLGFGTLPRGPSLAADDPDFFGYAEMVDDTMIVVGRSQQAVRAISGAVVGPLVVAGLVICISALLIGYVLSRSVSAKLQVIDNTLAEVARGNSDVRIPIGRFNDQIDHVSTQINRHLGRLSDLMGQMRNTIIAIAHDLKSPLSRASILLQETAQAEPAGPGAERLDRALAELDTLGGVIDTMLRISRIESSGDSSGFAPFELAPMMRDLAQTFEPVVEAAGQSFALSAPEGEGPWVFGDARMVQQMLVNLIENASRHSGTGTTIRLELATVEGAAQVRVTDTGRGIPLARYDDVFRPFRRLDEDRGTPGAGLGLALVAAIAMRHHARVTLSDNDPGLRVEVRFPRPEARFASEAAKVASM